MDARPRTVLLRMTGMWFILQCCMLQSWHDFDSISWRECCSNATSAETALSHGLKILGNDVHEGALSLCVRDAEAAGVKHALELSCKDCSDYSPPVAPSLVVVNPPWGYRLGSAGEKGNEEVESAWKELGKLLKHHCRCADVYILSGNSTLTRALHMKSDKKWPITMGGVECRLLHYYVLPHRVTTVSSPGQGCEKQSIAEIFVP